MSDDSMHVSVADEIEAYAELLRQARAERDELAGEVVALRALAHGRLEQMQADRAQALRWRGAAEYAAHQLEGARIWNGAAWHYNPLHPLHYRSALERLRDVLRA